MIVDLGFKSDGIIPASELTDDPEVEPSDIVKPGDVVSVFVVGVNAVSYTHLNSILNAQGIPMCGEFDVKTCIAMLIMDRLGIGGSFAEFHPFDFNEDFILSLIHIWMRWHLLTRQK